MSTNMNNAIETNKNRNEVKTLTLSWGFLLLLTLVAVVLSQLNVGANLLVISALGLTIIKSQIVVDTFMGLRSVDLRWRGIMLSYIVIVPFIITAIYLSA